MVDAGFVKARAYHATAGIDCLQVTAACITIQGFVLLYKSQ